MITSNNYTAVRLLLASLVLFSHSFALVGVEEPTIMGRSLGNLAVHGFFAISGYLITGSFLNSASLWEFASKRALRIIPALVVGYTFSKWAGHAHGNFVNNPIPYIFNGSIWTLSWEVLMYAGVGIGGMCALLNRNTIGALLVTSLLLLFTFHLDGPSDTTNVIAPLAILFLAGAFLHLSKDMFDGRKAGVMACITLFLLFFPPTARFIFDGIELIPFVWGPSGASSALVRHLIYLIALPFAVIFVCQHFPWSKKINQDYSYGVYIFAWPIQQIVMWHCTQNEIDLPPLGLFAVSGLLTFALAVASWHLIEKPSMDARKKLATWKRKILNATEAPQQSKAVLLPPE